MNITAEMQGCIDSEIKLLQTMKLPENFQNAVRDSLVRSIRYGISISEKAEKERIINTGSEFLDRFINNQAFGTCIGSGDDMFYVEHCMGYFRKQILLWREFEKQVREDEAKKRGLK